jgi:hypothetical protein
MVSINQILISARFMTTTGHFIALLLLFSTIDNNISMSLSHEQNSSAYASERKTAVQTCWVYFSTLYSQL